MDKYIKAVFNPGDRHISAPERLSQWDVGLVLRITGLTLPETTEVHFANSGDMDALRVIAKTKDGVTEATIPNEVLQSSGTAYAYVYVTNKESSRTEYKINLYINRREKPQDYAPENQPDVIGQLRQEISGKVDKYQGVENKGRVLVVGEDGNVVPGNAPSGEGGSANNEIINTMRGDSPLIIPDSTERKIKNLKLFGKTEQAQTTGANLFDISKVQSSALVINDGNTLTIKSNSGSIPESPNTLLDLCPTLKVGDRIVVNAMTKKCVKKIYLVKAAKVLFFNNPMEVTREMLDSSVAFYSSEDGMDGELTNIIINKGETAKPYEPYSNGVPSPSPDYPQEITIAGEIGTIDLKITGENVEPQSLTLQTPNGLAGIKVESGGNYTDENGQQWVCDEIDLERGKYVQRIGKNVYNGNETELWMYDNKNLLFYISPSNIKTESELMCDRYAKGDGDASITTKRGAAKSIFITDLSYTTLDDFKNNLVKRPLTIQFILSTPIETDLDSETIKTYKALHTNYPTTVINNDENAGMEISYVADAKNYIDNKFRQLSKATCNLQAQNYALIEGLTSAMSQEENP